MSEQAPKTNAEGLRRMVLQAVLEQKDYYVHAWATLSLYFLGWLPGLILNILILRQARKHSKLIKRQAAGAGCLWFLLIMNLVIPLLIFLAASSWATILNLISNRGY